MAIRVKPEHVAQLARLRNENSLDAARLGAAVLQMQAHIRSVEHRIAKRRGEEDQAGEAALRAVGIEPGALQKMSIANDGTVMMQIGDQIRPVAAVKGGVPIAALETPREAG